jgi:hypothetical protein
VTKWRLNYATDGISLLDVLALINDVESFLVSLGCSMDTETLIVSIPDTVNAYRISNKIAGFMIGWVEAHDGFCGGGLFPAE